MKDEKLAANIAEWTKDHQYTCLADANGVEVWRCQKPGSVHLAFDICITRFGISMFGDIDSLVFGVGSSYGLGFLARTPDGYMIEKLDERYRAEREFDQEYFHERLACDVFQLLDDKLADDQLPEWMRDELRAKVEDLEQTIAANALGQAEIDVVHERRRQVHGKGWTPEHDDEHDDCSLAAAAACYLIGSDEVTIHGRQAWPSGWHFKGPINGANYRRALVKGAALALAEIERIDRAADKKGGDQ